MRRLWIMGMIASAMVISADVAGAADQERSQERLASETQGKEQIYGSQLMTEQERAEHRDKLRAAKTAEERERIRNEHHEQMNVRAQERGVTLPDDPPLRGGGMGPGPGSGGRKP